MARNILQCFSEEHPHYPLTLALTKAVERYKAKASSEHTEQQVPPKVLVYQQPSHWTDAADALLQLGAAKTLKDITLSDEEDPKGHLIMEQDVFRVASLYLTFPLTFAVNTKYKTKITPATEDKTDKCRVDDSFNINAGTDQKRMIMIIEFKRMGLLKVRAFEAASVAQGGQAAKLAAMNKTKQFKSSVKEGTNAWWFTKQATAYSVKSNCKFVALCDYDSLVLLWFDNGLESAKITIGDRKDFRKLLLGFLDKACEYAGLEQEVMASN
ncbi:hypothetical protein FB567DRAFT_610255 [Paraphoma chrysanthemicola]|uniref:Uncharacterized protein n=1 Tax=Paraphoma chrysanthemicola TaxID=798071 RepID=A0A8K0RFR6_9PLEO|nr:hypothetical protein FB567DRAFT_610255 [Paraphoma chrysanthemicola]